MSKKINDDRFNTIIGLIFILAMVWFFFGRDTGKNEESVQVETTIDTTITIQPTSITTNTIKIYQNNLQEFVDYFQRELKKQPNVPEWINFKVRGNDTMVLVVPSEVKYIDKKIVKNLADNFNFAVDTQYELWATKKRGIDTAKKPKLLIETSSGEVIGRETSDREGIELIF